MKRFFKWVGRHVIPHVAYKGTKSNEGEISLSKDNLAEMKNKIEKFSEVGVKIKFKF